MVAALYNGNRRTIQIERGSYMPTENSYLIQEFSGDFALIKHLCLGSLLITKQLTEQHS